MADSPSIRDLARIARVHFTTVGLALRNDPRVAPTTRDRIHQLARAMDYKPNPLLAGMMSGVRRGRSRGARWSLAFCYHWTDRAEDWRRGPAGLYFEGARRRAESFGCGLTACNLANPEFTPRRWNEILRARNIQGLILTGFERVVESVALDWNAFATVRIDPNPRVPHFDTLCNHQEQMVRLCFRQAAARGYRRIGLVVPRSVDDRLGDTFLAGYLVEQSFLPARRRLPALRPDKLSFGGFRDWHRAHRPDAIVCLDGTLVLPWIRQLGIRMPAELGFADLNQLDETGAIAGVRKNFPLLGATAVDLVLGMLAHNHRGVPELPKITLVSGKWIEGASLRPLPADGPDPARLLG